MKLKLMSVVAAALILSGCASGVTRAPSGAPGRVSLSAQYPVASVSISLTEEAKKKAAENLTFNPDELLRHVKRALEANSLLKGSAETPRPNLEVQVKDMRVRSIASAVLLGFMAGADYIAADIVLKDTASKELDRFEVSTSYALGGVAGGQDSVRMGWLYQKFAEETVKELTKP